ncbi:MAG: hypothetical protein U9N39_00605 [Campylobacterota bacterium]|nr:hypothetical protein [Campylobacterota bacterium]
MNKNIFNRMKVSINKAYYTATRYDVDATFAYLYHEKELSIEELGKFVRISDQFMPIDKNHYFIHFAFTSHNDAFKASQNLIYHLDKHFNDASSSIAIDTFDTSKTSTIVYNRLVQILNEIKQNPYSRIEDEEVLNGIV